jgi:hypothetical protein
MPISAPQNSKARAFRPQLMRRPLGGNLLHTGGSDGPSTLRPPYLLIFGGLFLLTSSLQLHRLVNARSDIWWTPMARPVPLAQSQDRVEIYARGKLLQQLLAEGQLRIGDAADTSGLTPREVELRFNNWDRV